MKRDFSKLNQGNSQYIGIYWEKATGELKPNVLSRGSMRFKSIIKLCYQILKEKKNLQFWSHSFINICSHKTFIEHLLFIRHCTRMQK